MIARLRGQLVAKGADDVIVDMAGIGWRVLVPRNLLEHLKVGDEVTLVTHLVVKENELSLVGFGSPDELRVFEMLLRVSGIGPRTALNIMSFLSLEALRQAIANGDVANLARIPGIGRKTAERLVVDLRDKIGGVGVTERVPFVGLTAAEAEVMAALTTLGYSVAEAEQAVRALPDERLTVEERLRAALRYLGGGS